MWQSYFAKVASLIALLLDWKDSSLKVEHPHHWNEECELNVLKNILIDLSSIVPIKLYLKGLYGFVVIVLCYNKDVNSIVYRDKVKKVASEEYSA